MMAPGPAGAGAMPGPTSGGTDTYYGCPPCRRSAWADAWQFRTPCACTADHLGILALILAAVPGGEIAHTSAAERTPESPGGKQVASWWMADSALAIQLPWRRWHVPGQTLMNCVPLACA